MEQGQYSVLMKRRQFLKSHFQVSINSLSETWEEKAFAKDAAGSLGGCIWPPRSYTCSFCRREFKSAQALGGHMNVHRRDRAKLKQSLSPKNEVVPNQNQNPNPLKPSDPQSPHPAADLAHSFSSSRVSASAKNFGTCSFVQGQHLGLLSSYDDEVLGVKPAVAGSMEELDLELRLGAQPKPKSQVRSRWPTRDPDRSHQMIECDLNCERTAGEARRPSSQEELTDLAHKERSHEPREGRCHSSHIPKELAKERLRGLTGNSE
ncbi:hypothetical protein Gogos_000256 [Gossypium gossypioides]|uniref:C2H2-type domain-containing protein n=1 Tax=Gossypium gossypioides TaxID=34282 RepID=A0A7J9CSW8_GOSGO|nr:hypothetical protein [Gossypium gossypioides]